MQLWSTNVFQNVTLVRGQGSTVWDESGQPYLDLLSGCWSAGLGYGHPRLTAAVEGQIHRLTHANKSLPSRELQQALDRLTDILPAALCRAVFLNTGSEAVELALKMAHAATGKKGVVVNEQGYYGATTYTTVMSRPAGASNYLPKFSQILRIPAPDCERCPAGCDGDCAGRFPCLDQLADLATSGADLAAVVYLPVLGNGIITPPLGYGTRLRDLATQAGALLIAEEVTTGMGRTGRWFGFQHEGIIPDILVIGKTIGGGFPVAAVVTTEEVQQRCSGSFGAHVQSHQNDPLSGRIATTVIEIMTDEKLVEQSASLGEYMRAGLEQLKPTYLRSVRGRGLMIGAELRPELAPQGTAMAQALLRAGYIVDFQPATATFRFFPPFVITRAEIDSFLQAFKNVLSGE